MSEFWLSLYLDLPDSNALATDEVLQTVVAPLLRDFQQDRAISAYFFIRYRDPGPHIRLRLLAPEADHELLLGRVDSAIRATRSVGGPSITGFRNEAYAPEFERYGGTEGVAISERMFEISSEMCLAVVPMIRVAAEPSELRFGHGVLAVAVLVACLVNLKRPAECARFLERYERRLVSSRVRGAARKQFRTEYDDWVDLQTALLEKVASVVEAVGRPEDLPEPIGSGVRGFHQVREAILDHASRSHFVFYGKPVPQVDRSVAILTSSYLHMHLNRLGVRPLQEPLVCGIARRAFERSLACA